MKRNAYKHEVDKYFKKIKIKKYYPLFKYRKCEKCNQEFLLEEVYKIKFPYKKYIGCRTTYNYSDIYKTIYGCKECFHSEKDCLQFLQDKGMIKSKQSILFDKFKKINDDCPHDYDCIFFKKCDENCEEFQKFIKENQLEEYIDEQIDLNKYN